MNNSIFSGCLLLFSRNLLEHRNCPIVWFHQRIYLHSWECESSIQYLYFANFFVINIFQFHKRFLNGEMPTLDRSFEIHSPSSDSFIILFIAVKFNHLLVFFSSIFFFLFSCEIAAHETLSFLAMAIFHVVYNTVLFGNWTIPFKMKSEFFVLYNIPRNRTFMLCFLFIFSSFTLLK